MGLFCFRSFLMRMATRTHLHRSRFIATLSELVGIDSGSARTAFADKLGQWIQIADAIGLRATHNVPAPTPSAAPVVQPVPATSAMADPAEQQLATLDAAFARTRSALEGSIAAGTQAAGAGKGALPLPARGTPLELAGSFEPFRRYYVAHQRDMDLKAKPLRARLREAAANATPALRQLAAMDAAMDGILVEREAQLLCKVPGLLEKRFKHLRSAHLHTLQALQQEDRLELWLQPGGWMARFCQEIQAVLLAEWDMRLLPALGLLEALHHEHTKPL